MVLGFQAPSKSATVRVADDAVHLPQVQSFVLQLSQALQTQQREPFSFASCQDLPKLEAWVSSAVAIWQHKQAYRASDDCKQCAQ